MMTFKTDAPVITIDGPSGTGKGTLCHLLASHLQWNFLDSGVLYRVLAYAAIQQDITLEINPALIALAHALPLRFEKNTADSMTIMLENEDVTKQIRSEACGQAASKIAVNPEVRAALLARQRAFAVMPGLVTDGRDMGTVVFPNATLKIFLDASNEERATRRYLQLKQSGIDVSLAQVIDEITKRDERDRTRSTSPLKPADDAIVMDTTGQTIAQVFDNVVKLVNKCLIIE